MQKEATYKVLDYDPFGFLMPSRQFTDNQGYKFGFGGHEKNDEISGNGNFLAFEGYGYESRLGRRWQIDPMTYKYAGLSPYIAFNNNPNYYIDPNGEEAISAAIEGAASFAISIGMDFFASYLLEGKSVEESLKDVGWGSATADALTTAGLSLIGAKGVGMSKKLTKFANSRIGKVTADMVTNFTTNISRNIAEGKYDDEEGNFDKSKLLNLEELTFLFGEATVEALLEQGLGEAGKRLAKKLGIPLEKLCFMEGTEVYIENDFKSIENIVVGDLVWSKNDNSGVKSLKEVSEVFVRESNHLRILILKGDTIYTTNSHPFKTSLGIWKQAQDLLKNENVEVYSGESLKIDTVYQIDTLVTVYNFTVSDYHTYFVTRNKILVHNAGYGGKGLFPNKDELAKKLNTTVKDFHDNIKPGMKIDFAKEMKKINSTNPDIGIDDGGNIILKNPKTGKTIETDVPLDLYIED